MTFTAGQRVTAAALNQVTVNSVTSGSRPGSPVAGELIWETDTNRLRVYDGTSWDFAAGKTPSVMAQRTSTQSINNTTITAILWNTAEVYITDSGLHSTSVNPDRITPTEEGLWSFEWAVVWAANATGEREGFLWLNGGGVKYGWQSMTTSGGNFVFSSAVTLRMNGTTDYASINVFQNSGGALNACNSTDPSSYFIAKYIGKY